MNDLFYIDSAMIRGIDDTTARELIARLCRATLRAQGVSESHVSWGGDQRSNDGGVDVHVSAPHSLPGGGYLPHANTSFQVKAERMPASKIAGEMKKRGTLRPSIQELAAVGGAYILASTKEDCSASMLKERLTAMANCLGEAAIERNVTTDFYDSRRIADWVEQHPTVAVWLREKMNCGIRQWRPYGAWAYMELDVKAEYLLDDEVRVYPPHSPDSIPVSQAIARLRQRLASPVVIRLIGLSGVGKTRLVQALFDERVSLDIPALSQENVIYTDIAYNPNPSPQDLLESLRMRGAETVVIVDNCSPETHSQLTQICIMEGCRLKLITIEYDIREDLPEQTECYRLESSSVKVIERLVQRRYPKVSSVDASAIAGFALGNARIALALASTVGNGGELSKLQNAELFRRLLHQRHAEDADLQRCAEAASILYSFDAEDESSSGEAALLASMVDVSLDTFLRRVAEIEARGLVQRRGKWRAVLPDAFSNRLASWMLERALSSRLRHLLSRAVDERITRSFTRRLGYLHDCSRAQRLVSILFAPDGRLGNVSRLSPYEVQMFCNLAPVNPQAALAALTRARRQGLLPILSDESRPSFARIARQIAYDAQYFEEAADFLAELVLTEPEGKNHSASFTKLKQLFYVVLSGTHASVGQRSAYVEELLRGSESARQTIGCELLGAALTSSEISASNEFNFGARKRDFGWEPQTDAEASHWYLAWLDLAVSLGETESDVGRLVRHVLAEHFRDLWRIGGIRGELISVVERVVLVHPWPEAWIRVRELLHYGDEHHTPSDIEQLRHLESLLSPRDLLGEIRTYVLVGANDLYLTKEDAEADESFIDSNRKLESGHIKRERLQVLGVAAVSEPGLLESLIGELCASETGFAGDEFGRSVGRNHSRPIEVMNAVRVHIAKEDVSNIHLRWVLGVLQGWMEVDPDGVEVFLEEGLSDSVWISWFVALQTHSNLVKGAFKRLMTVAGDLRCPTWQFRGLLSGNALGVLGARELIAITCKLATTREDGLGVALDVLHWNTHRLKEHSPEEWRDFQRALSEFLNDINWSMVDGLNHNEEHYLAALIECALNADPSEQWVRQLLSRIVEASSSTWPMGHSAYRCALKVFFQKCSHLTLEIVCVPGEKRDFRLAKDLILGWDEESALAGVDVQELVAWCNVEPGLRYPFVASVYPLFDRRGEAVASVERLESVKHLLALSPDKARFIDEIVNRFNPAIWSGRLSEELTSRLSMLGQLSACDDPEIVELVSRAKNKLLERIERRREDERLEDFARNQRFE